jgi:hypothetical protein
MICTNIARPTCVRLTCGGFGWHTASVLPVLIVVAVVLLVTAAVFDWRARGRGDHHRITADYWKAVAEARREERREHATKYFARFLPKR